ncbi:MAG: DUF4838 domain-containing protein [Phycisphaerae bacterium]
MSTSSKAARDDRKPLVIADSKRSDYTIVCKRDSSPATLLAATELQYFLARSTGARLEIMAAATPPEKSIILQSDHSLPFDSFVISVVGPKLIITGNDGGGDPKLVDFERPVSCGTLYGVYEFLERFLGVRFYWPDELGIVVPPHDKLSLPGRLEIRQAPHFAFRRLRYGPHYRNEYHESATHLWGRRLRLGASTPLRFYHAWKSILNVEEWARQGHPEYAALVGRKRQTRYDRKSDRIVGQVCTSNKEVQDIFVQAARKSKDLMFSVSPNDGHTCHCGCPSCRALDSGRTVQGGPWAGRRDLSDRMVTFYNLIAERSGRPVGGYAYKEYAEVPAHTQLHPNVTISMVINNAWLSGDPATVRYARHIFKTWGEYSSKTSAYDILFRPGPGRRTMHQLIAPLGIAADRRVRLIAEAGLAGAQLYIAPEMEQGGADAYVVAKLLWNPDTDTAPIREEYYSDLYGPGWSHVQRLYQLAEERWRHVVGNLPMPKWRPTMIELAPELTGLVDQAIRDAGSDELVLRRLERLRRSVLTMASTPPG